MIDLKLFNYIVSSDDLMLSIACWERASPAGHPPSGLCVAYFLSQTTPLPLDSQGLPEPTAVSSPPNWSIPSLRSDLRQGPA